jgi:hypothetical protein
MVLSSKLDKQRRTFYGKVASVNESIILSNELEYAKANRRAKNMKKLNMSLLYVNGGQN